ncbi:MAG TPA: hypothetical protein VEC57_12590 [Candidatus Limnocylindrales bacterium]|nr:hypothetical protein [Candidatus Limnocylindrales bacterium]
MTYLNFDLLESIDVEAFRKTSPYPWINPEGALTEQGYQRLLATLPRKEDMQPFFGVRRKHGQQPHDRYVLEYTDKAAVSPEWREFIEELRGDRYGRFLRAMFGRGRLWLNFHWHYTPASASVSPHCDSPRKLGSHIFYFNTESDWDASWGGETVILDDEGRFPTKSAPKWEDFPRSWTGKAMGNRSLLFARRGNSWHGVREIRSPEGRLRRVFIVVVNDMIRSIPFLVRQRLLHQEAGY